MPRMNKLSTYKTSVMCTNSRISVTYHTTLIVDVVDGAVTLDSGGYQTVTTKRKMNQAANQFGLGYQIHQKNFNWFVTINGVTYPFHDGITIHTQRVAA